MKQRESHSSDTVFNLASLIEAKLGEPSLAWASLNAFLASLSEAPERSSLSATS